MFTSSLRLTSRVCLVPAFQCVLKSHTNRTNGMWEMWKNACTICWCWCCVEYVAHCKSINIHTQTQIQLTHFTLILSFNFRKPKYNNMAAMELSSSFVHFARLLCFSLNRRIAAFSLSLSLSLFASVLWYALRFPSQHHRVCVSARVVSIALADSFRIHHIVVNEYTRFVCCVVTELEWKKHSVQSKSISQCE